MVAKIPKENSRNFEGSWKSLHPMAGSSVDLSRYFKEGAEVEINSDDEGFRRCWFAGTVIRPPKNFKKISAKVLVVYKTLMADEAGKRPLREELTLVQLRPPPHRENRINFKLSEGVDAYYNGGWWEGIVTEVLEKGEYLVFFRGSREQLAFKASQLRMHREWVYGKWVPPLDGMVEDGEDIPLSAEVEADNEVVVGEHNFSPQTSGEMETNKEVIEHSFRPGALVEVSTDEEGFEGAWFAATIVKELNRGKYLIEYQNLKDEDDMKLLQEEVDVIQLRP